MRRSGRTKKIKKNLSKVKELSRTMDFGNSGGGSFLVTTPEHLNAAAQDLQGIASSINQANANAGGPQGIPPAIHD